MKNPQIGFLNKTHSQAHQHCYISSETKGTESCEMEQTEVHAAIIFSP